MMKISLIFILLLASCTTEPVEIHDDNAVLQTLLNMGTDTVEIKDCVDLPESVCVWEEDRITQLNLFNMGLNGNIPDEIGNLTELTHLGLKNNNLSGGIPESIGNLTNLTQLNLADNALSGSIPDTIGNLIFLTNLVLSNNEFSGSIPNSISELSILHTFLADSNNFSGTLPNDICNIYDQDSNFELSGNQFCNDFPSCLDSPEILGYQNCDTSCKPEYEFNDGYCYYQIDLNVLQTMIDNSLSIHPDSLNMNMDADSNQVIEPLELGTQEWSAGRLEKLDCHWVDTASCNLSITIPKNIIELDSLQYLNLQDNNLTGSVPETIGDLPELSTLKLQNNKIGCYEFDFAEDTCRVHCNDDIDVCSGYVSENICGIETIENVDLSNNMLCPCYPYCFDQSYVTKQDITGCSYCNEGYTQICDKRPDSHGIINGDSLCFNTNDLAVLQAFIDNSDSTLNMEMDANNSGVIEPLELGTQYWDYENLVYLYAEGKGLSGQIPSVLNSLDSLKAIWLYNNYFSGQIPESICNLSNLKWDSTGTTGISSLKSYIYNNQLCPPYTECIAPFVGEQNTTDCE